MNITNEQKNYDSEEFDLVPDYIGADHSDRTGIKHIQTGMHNTEINKKELDLLFDYSQALELLENCYLYVEKKEKEMIGNSGLFLQLKQYLNK